MISRKEELDYMNESNNSYYNTNMYLCFVCRKTIPLAENSYHLYSQQSETMLIFHSHCWQNVAGDDWMFNVNY